MGLSLSLSLSLGSAGGGGLPALPTGFAYVQFSDGAYEVWPDGAYVVEYVG